jgi:hypothetical protein
VPDTGHLHDAVYAALNLLIAVTVYQLRKSGVYIEASREVVSLNEEGEKVNPYKDPK